MAENLDQRLAVLSKTEHRELVLLFDAFLADTAANRAAIVGITAQLDADGGVTDTDYAANNDPAALTVET